MAKNIQKQKKAAAAAIKAQRNMGHRRRPAGASISELTKATDWQAHSVRGFLSATIRKKMGLQLTYCITGGKDRRYRIAEIL